MGKKIGGESMALTKEQKLEIIGKYQLKEGDTR